MFLEVLRQRLIKETSNYYADNFDYYAFPEKRPAKKKVINALKRVIFTRPILGTLLYNNYLYKNIFLKMLKFDKYTEALAFFYEHLESAESKELMLQITSFRLLGYLKVKLPLSNPAYWKGIKDMEALASENDRIDVRSVKWKLYGHDLSKIGFPLKVYVNSKAAYTTFVVQQYIKNIDGKNLGPVKGDVALDLGACYGDTAIFFGYLVGNAGKVYSFEFIPGNLNVLKKNISINENVKNQIEVVEHPLWDTSDTKVYFKDAGPASSIGFEKFEGYEGETTTLSIDDFVTRYKIQKLDFIKTDIEGAEPLVLKGAVNTLKRFTPKLAISIYHNMNDFTGIIKQINDLNLGYKFYLGHYTIYASETILYAIKG